MFLKKAKRELQILKAFQELFLDENKELKDAGKIVISFLRDEVGGRGELGKNGVPYFYDGNNSFDVGAAGFLLGKRRVFDLIIKYLSLDEREVFKLISAGKKRDESFEDEINV